MNILQIIGISLTAICIVSVIYDVVRNKKDKNNE